MDAQEKFIRDFKDWLVKYLGGEANELISKDYKLYSDFDRDIVFIERNGGNKLEYTKESLEDDINFSDGGYNTEKLNNLLNKVFQGDPQNQKKADHDNQNHH